MTQFRNVVAEGVHLCLDLSWIWNGHVHDFVEEFGGIQNQLAEVVGVCVLQHDMVRLVRLVVVPLPVLLQEIVGPQPLISSNPENGRIAGPAGMPDGRNPSGRHRTRLGYQWPKRAPQRAPPRAPPRSSVVFTRCFATDLRDTPQHAPDLFDLIPICWQSPPKSGTKCLYAGTIQYMRALEGHSGGFSVDPEKSKALFKYHTDGPITSITLGQHSITDLFPILVSSVEELVEIEDGKRASSRQWTLCTSPAKFRRMTVDQPRIVPPKINWRRQQDAVYWFDLELAQRKGLVFWQTLSNAWLPANDQGVERQD